MGILGVSLSGGPRPVEFMNSEGVGAKKALRIFFNCQKYVKQFSFDISYNLYKNPVKKI